MLSFLLGSLLLIASVLSLPDTYNSKYDNVDLDEVLRSDRLMQNYVKCLLNEGPCTADGKMLKDKLIQIKDFLSFINFSETLPDAMETGCEKCTEKQRIGSKKTIDFIYEHRPDDWVKMEKLYDPNGVYRQRYNIGKAAGTTVAEGLTMDPNSE